jgi:predicted  nucleic acid-binding Zn-ribbon protein
MLLSKALKMQQDTEDRKNEVIIEGLEDKIKKLEDSLRKKDILLQSAEGSLVEARSQNDKLNWELGEARIALKERSERFDLETKDLKAKVEDEAERNAKLNETSKEITPSEKNLRDKCSDFAAWFINRLKEIFNSVGATSEEITPSVEDIPGAFDHIENEVQALDEVITGHGDFCALVASRGIVVAFMKVGCNHARAVNKPNFNLSSSDLVDVPTEARSIGNRFITQIWAKGGHELAGDEARKLLNSVWNFTFVFLP